MERAINSNYRAKEGQRATGIEPAWPAWKAGALPLSYAREVTDGLPGGHSFSKQSKRRPPLNLVGAAGRSVVASAPALGAGDREFESPRPDHQRKGEHS